MFFLMYYIISFILNANSHMNFPIFPVVKNNNLNLLDNSQDIRLEVNKNNYKKTITRLNFLKEEKTMKIFDYKNLNHNTNKILSVNSIFIYNITDFITNNISPLNLKNEILYLINRKTKVYIHIELLFPRTNIYHIGVTFKSIISNIRYDIRGINLDNLYYFFLDNLENELSSKTLFWAYSDKTLDEIIEYEKSIEHKYILGIYDCRHYVRNLTMWSSNKPTPIWKLIQLIH